MRHRHRASSSSSSSSSSSASSSSYCRHQVTMPSSSSCSHHRCRHRRCRLRHRCLRRRLRRRRLRLSSDLTHLPESLSHRRRPGPRLCLRLRLRQPCQQTLFLLLKFLRTLWQTSSQMIFYRLLWWTILNDSSLDSMNHRRPLKSRKPSMEAMIELILKAYLVNALPALFAFMFLRKLQTDTFVYT